MFKFLTEPDLDTLFEILTAQKGAWPGLGTQPVFKTPDDLWVIIIQMQQ